MSGNQETRVRQPSWLCSDFNAGIPIKKRKFFVMPVSPPAEEASTALSENSSQSCEQSCTGNARNVSCSLDVNEKTLPEENGGSRATDVVTDQKIIEQLSLTNEERLHLFTSDFIGNVGKIEKPGGVKTARIVFGPPKENTKLADTENVMRGLVDQCKVKTEVVDLPVSSISFTDVEKKEQLVELSGSNMVSSSVQSFSSATLASKEKPVEAESSGVHVSSEKTGMRIDRIVLTMNGMIEETCDKKNVSGGCQAELSSGSGDATLSLGFKTVNNIQHGEKEESLALNSSLSMGACPPHKNDDISVSTSAGGCYGINRSNWDLNTTMDAWEDARNCASVSKTNIAFLSSKSSPCDDKASSAYVKTIMVSEELRKRSVGSRFDVATSTQSDHQDNSGCSLSLGLSSFPPAEGSPVSARTTQTNSAYASISRPMMTAGNLNSVSRVKSEYLDEVVRQETENAKICPVELSSNRVKQELVEKYSQETISSSGFLNSIDHASIKAKSNNCIQSEAVNRKDGKLNQPDMPITQPSEMRDLRTCSTSKQKQKQMSHSIGCRSASLTGMTVNPGDLVYSECVLHENSAQSSSEAHGILCKTLKHAETDMNSTCFGQSDNIRNVSGMTVASLTEDKSVDDRRTCRLKEPPLNSRGTDESSLSDEEKINLSGDMLEEDLYGSDFKSDGAHEISKMKREQDGRINEGNVQGSAVACATEDNSPANMNKLEHTKCGDSETIAVVFRGDFQNSSCVDERGSESALLSKTVEMPSSEDEIKGLIHELQIRARGSGETEAQNIQDGEPSSYQVIHTSEGVSAKTLDASSSFGPSRVHRERLSNLPFESRKFHSQGSCLRDEAFNDVSYKFSRERYHDRFVNQRLNFMPDRRRFFDRTESNPRDRDLENFEFDNYGSTSEDGAFVRRFRRGRRSWNDQATFFPHSFSRRQSPVNSYTHREPRNSEDAPAFHGFRDGEKFARGLPRNNIDPMARSQRSYEDLDGRFTRGQRNFSTNHKRPFPWYHSRSQNRSRVRSPGPCSSFKNSSPDGFSGHPEFPCRRSSPNYRMERIRSPDPSGFPRDMTVRRHGSPPYPSRPSNVSRDVGRGYRRPGISFRNHPDRAFRNHGKFNIMDSRERVEYSDDMFEEPSRSDQFGEFGVNVNVERRRRRFGDRRDGIHSFRSSFNTDDCTPSNIENDPGSMRFGQEDTADTEEQGNSRELHRHDKNITENSCGRARNDEDKEESSRNVGESWPDGEFNGEEVKQKVCQ